jgi:ligand-binding sensor domain-containing protein
MQVAGASVSRRSSMPQEAWPKMRLGALSTENGIFRYDGTHFQSYGKKDGIPTSNAAVFGEAPDGSLLAGGSFGLYRLTANQFKQIPMPGAARVSFGAGIRSDGNGRSYIATDRGLVAITREEGTNKLKLELLPAPPHLGDSVAYGVLAETNGSGGAAVSNSVLRKAEKRGSLASLLAFLRLNGKAS